MPALKPKCSVCQGFRAEFGPEELAGHRLNPKAPRRTVSVPSTGRGVACKGATGSIVSRKQQTPRKVNRFELVLTHASASMVQIPGSPKIHFQLPATHNVVRPHNLCSSTISTPLLSSIHGSNVFYVLLSTWTSMNHHGQTRVVFHGRFECEPSRTSKQLNIRRYVTYTS